MPKWELSRIEQRTKVKSESKPFFGTPEMIEVWQFVAVAETTSGTKIIDQTPECEIVYHHYYRDRDSGRAWNSPKDARLVEQNRANLERLDQGHSMLVGRLLADGWEPMEMEKVNITGFNIVSRPKVLKRQTP